jgi:cation:H+ antiporter
MFVLIKSADYFTESAEKIGLVLKISPFVIGVTIISIGTSLPELATSVMAAIKNQTEIVAATAIGANIINILLIIGLSAMVAGRLVVKRSLLELELPILSAATALIVVILWDKQITIGEGIVAILGYMVYGFYTLKTDKEEKKKPEGIIPGEDIPTTRKHRYYLQKKHREFNWKLVVILFLSLIFLYFAAEWTVKSIAEIALLIGIPTSLVVMSAMVIGTSSPELVVAVGAAKGGKYEISLGTIFGSNIFNILIVIGIPSLIRTLALDQSTFSVGLPFIIGATFLYVFSSISGKIYRAEGFLYLLIFILYIAKLFGLF